jgi:hypothetical protein
VFEIGQKGHHEDMVTPPPNPFVMDIVRRLQTDGRFVMCVEPHGWRCGQLQAVVDVDWAARQAGRILNRPLRLTTSREGHGGGTYTVTAEVVR